VRHACSICAVVIKPAGQLSVMQPTREPLFNRDLTYPTVASDNKIFFSSFY
jgi:hypothetical protein